MLSRCCAVVLLCCCSADVSTMSSLRLCLGGGGALFSFGATLASQLRSTRNHYFNNGANGFGKEAGG